MLSDDLFGVADEGKLVGALQAVLLDVHSEVHIGEVLEDLLERGLTHRVLTHIVHALHALNHAEDGAD